MSRIGIVAVSQPHFGGTYQYTRSMIEALLRVEDYRYTIYTHAGNNSYSDFGLPVVRLPTPARGGGRLLLKRLSAGRAAGLFGQERAVIAPIYSVWLLASTPPFAFTLHDLQEKYHPQYFSLAQRLWRHATGRALTRAALRIICESQYVKRDIERFYQARAEKIVVIPAPPVSALREALGAPKALAGARLALGLPERYLFYPAQFWPHKNHARLVEAFARVARSDADCHLVLTGRPRDQFDAVMAQVAALGLESRVRHLGHLQELQLAAVYRGATMLVMPTLFESVSIPVYEAFMLGVPVCASNVVALPEQIGDAGLLFDPLCVDDMAAKIVRLLTDPALRSELVARGARRVLNLSMETYARDLRTLLADLLAPARPKTATAR